VPRRRPGRTTVIRPRRRRLGADGGSDHSGPGLDRPSFKGCSPLSRRRHSLYARPADRAYPQ
jgi:hypothetical protein